MLIVYMAYMMFFTEFLKIKEKQKAFGMNNGLRVHEVSSCFEFSHFSKVFIESRTFLNEVIISERFH